MALVYDPKGVIDTDLDTQVPYALPPGGGTEAVPLIQQFQGLVSSFSKIYRNPDQAYQDNRENARNMLNDPAVMQPLEFRQLTTAELNDYVEPEDSNDPEQADVARQLERIIHEIPYWIEYKKWLLQGIFFGKSAVWNKYTFDFGSGKKRLIVADWLPVHGDTIRYRWSDGRMGLMTLQAGSSYKPVTAMPSDEGLVHALTDWERKAYVAHFHGRSASDFFHPEGAGYVHGRGLRDKLYWIWWLKQQLLAWITTWAETSALGIWVYYYEAGNKKSLQKTEEIAQSQSVDLRVMMPRPIGGEKQGQLIDRIEPGAQGAETLIRLIREYAEGHLTRMIVGQHTTSEKMPAGMGSSIGDIQASSFAKIIRADAAALEQTLTRQLLWVLQDYNFPATRFRCRYRIAVEEPNKLEFLQSAKILWEMGVPLSASELRRVAGFTTPTKDDEVVSRPADMPLQGQGYQTGSTATVEPNDRTHFAREETADEFLAEARGA